MVNCNQLTYLPFKGLNYSLRIISIRDEAAALGGNYLRAIT